MIRTRLKQRIYTLHVNGAGDQLRIAASVRNYYGLQLIIAAVQEFLEEHCVHIEIQARLYGRAFFLSVGDAPALATRCATVIDESDIDEDLVGHERQATHANAKRLLTTGEHA